MPLNKVAVYSNRTIYSTRIVSRGQFIHLGVYVYTEQLLCISFHSIDFSHCYLIDSGRYNFLM
jgi:hypothetical protein